MTNDKKIETVTVTMTKDEWDTILKSAAFAYNTVACFAVDSVDMANNLLNGHNSYLQRKYNHPNDVVIVLTKLATQIKDTDMLQLSVAQANQVIQKGDTDDGSIPN